jgi:hypothetical protein
MYHTILFSMEINYHTDDLPPSLQPIEKDIDIHYIVQFIGSDSIQWKKIFRILIFYILYSIHYFTGIYWIKFVFLYI